MEPDNWSRMSEEDLLDHFRKDDADFKSFYEFNAGSREPSPPIANNKSPAGMLEETSYYLKDPRDILPDRRRNLFGYTSCRAEMLDPDFESRYPQYNPLDCEDILGEMEADRSATSASVTISTSAHRKMSTVSREKQFCNCEKSKCLKMYCACFRQGLSCSDMCRCKQCSNTVEHRMKGLHADNVQQQVSDTHQDNADMNIESMITDVYCSCRTSFCEKSYCACARNKNGCSAKCKCFHCKNHFGLKPKFDHMPAMVKCY